MSVFTTLPTSKPMGIPLVDVKPWMNIYISCWWLSITSKPKTSTTLSWKLHWQAMFCPTCHVSSETWNDLWPGSRTRHHNDEFGWCGQLHAQHGSGTTWEPLATTKDCLGGHGDHALVTWCGWCLRAHYFCKVTNKVSGGTSSSQHWFEW